MRGAEAVIELLELGEGGLRLAGPGGGGGSGAGERGEGTAGTDWADWGRLSHSSSLT